MKKLQNELPIGNSTTPKGFPKIHKKTLSLKLWPLTLPKPVIPKKKKKTEPVAHIKVPKNLPLHKK
jgi:hypothetical protein